MHEHLGHHRLRMPRPLVPIAVRHDLGDVVQRMHEMLVRGLMRFEKSNAREMYVLVVDDERGSKQATTPPQEKSPTSPGGRWGARWLPSHIRWHLARRRVKVHPPFTQVKMPPGRIHFSSIVPARCLKRAPRTHASRPTFMSGESH